MSDNRRRKANSQMPVSAHPAFPIIIGVWFAALFGIGSMVLPLDMFERFVLSSGLADVYAGAQPPLGAAARIVIAVAGAALGALAGVFVARKVAAANAGQTATRRAAASPEPEFAADHVKRPISAHDELGEGGLDADTDPLLLLSAGEPSRRRALAVTDESEPSDFLSVAPLPGRFLDDADEPLELTAFDDATPVPAEDEAPTAAEAPAFHSSSPSTPPSAAHEAFAECAAAQPGAEPTAPLAERALDHLGMVELVERFALALQGHRESVASVYAPVASVPRSSEPELPADAEELVPAFAASTGLPTPPASTIPAALRPFSFEDEEAEQDAERADSAPHLDLTAALLQTRAPDTAKALTPASSDDFDEPEDEMEEEADAGYPSLLAMKSPFGAPRESFRIDDETKGEDDEPVVAFPVEAVRRAPPADDQSARAEEAASQASMPAPPPATRANGANTERALREALEKLQRMSGAA